MADQRVAAPVGDVALAATGTAYTTAGLATQAGSRPRHHLQLVPAAKDTNAVADGEAGLRACLTALGVQSWLPVRGDVATLDGAPAVIAVVDSGSTRDRVCRVARTATRSTRAVLAGPLTLP